MTIPKTWKEWDSFQKSLGEFFNSYGFLETHKIKFSSDGLTEVIEIKLEAEAYRPVEEIKGAENGQE